MGEMADFISNGYDFGPDEVLSYEEILKALEEDKICNVANATRHSRKTKQKKNKMARTPINKTTGSPVKSTPAPTARPGSSPVDESEQEEGNRTSYASAFDEVPESTTVKDGKYAAILAEMVLQDPDEKGQSVRRKVIIVSEGDFRGQDIATWSKIADAEGNISTKSVQFLKQDLAKLGYPGVKFADLPEVCEQITDEKPAIAVQVKTNGAYTNVYINGLLESCEEADSFKEEHPEL